MKTKSYRYGKHSFRAYYKPVGKGFETGFYYGDKPIFVGNFIHASEATRWYGIMNREIAKFGRKYTVGYEFPIAWFNHFVKNHLYRYYYAYLDKLFARYTRSYGRAFSQNVRQFQRNKHRWQTDEKSGTRKYLKAA